MSSVAKPKILCVANWQSDVGYAWWLMESYWVKISETFEPKYETWIAYPTINTIPEEIEESSIKCKRHNFAATTVSSVLQNVQFIRKNNIKILYLSDYGVARFQYFLYRLAGIRKIIVHDHSPGLRTKPKGIKRFLKKLYVNSRFTRVDAAFGATSFVTQRTLDTSCFAEKRCFTVPNGIRLINSSNLVSPLQAQMEKAALSNKTIIVTASRANRYKGVFFALDVIHQLVKKDGFSNIFYLFCGDGPDLEAMVAHAEKLGITEYCSFPGRVNNVRSLYSCCDIGFQPSQGEVGYSLSILEYMIEGLPVIVPDNKSVCSATEDGNTGKIYKENDISSACDAFRFYLTQPEKLASNGKSARHTVEADYTLEKTHAALVLALKKIINQ